MLLTWFYYYCPVPINDNFDWHLQTRSIHPSDDDDEGALIGHRSIAISSSLQEDQCYLANDLQCHYRASIQRRESFNNIISCSSGLNIKVQHKDRIDQNQSTAFLCSCSVHCTDALELDKLTFQAETGVKSGQCVWVAIHLID